MSTDGTLKERHHGECLTGPRQEAMSPVPSEHQKRGREANYGALQAVGSPTALPLSLDHGPPGNPWYRSGGQGARLHLLVLMAGHIMS